MIDTVVHNTYVWKLGCTSEFNIYFIIYISDHMEERERMMAASLGDDTTLYNYKLPINYLTRNWYIGDNHIWLRIF